MIIVIIYLEEMYIKIKYSVFVLSAWYSQSSSMVNIFGGSIASGPGKLQVVKKVVVTVGKFKYYIDEIQQNYELEVTPYRLHKNVDGVSPPPPPPPFMFMKGGYMHWTMLPRWRLVINILKRKQ